MDPLNFKERNQKQLMEMFHDVFTAYRKVHNTSGHHEDDFLSLAKQKTFGKVWGVYYLHLWLQVHDNLTDFFISGLPSEAIIDSTQTKFSFTNNLQSSNTTSDKKKMSLINCRCLLITTSQLMNTRKNDGKNRKLGKSN